MYSGEASGFAVKGGVIAKFQGQSPWSGGFALPEAF